jgi:hypothetical protein
VAEPSTAPVTELDVLRRQARKAWNWFEGTVSDVSAEQANWWPPGTANSIGTTYLHVVINTDVEINRLISTENRSSSRWGGGIGQGALRPRRFDRWVRNVAIDWDLPSTASDTEAFLDSLDDLTDGHLEMPVDPFRSGDVEGRDLYELHGSNHPHIHGGEIACLKGLQGGIGWAESEAFHAPKPFETSTSGSPFDES